MQQSPWTRAIGRRAPQVPIVVSRDNIYVAWWINKTVNNNEEVMFRASNDGGQTFGPVLRLAANSTISSTETTAIAVGEAE
jgi:hypothetical protein